MHPASMALSLKQKQIDAVVRMLNFNLSDGNKTAIPNEETYKVLLLDRFCVDIISPLLKVSDLRKCGVTLHLQIEADRQSIPGVPAVYFVRPTQQNIQRIIQDATRGLYDKFYLNFTSSLSRALIEELAAGILKADCLGRIARVFDQYTEFICLESTLFSLAQPRAYVQLNDPTSRDSDVEACVEAIVDGLFCVFTTLGVVPLIRCPSQGPAEMVSRQLDARIRSHLSSQNNVFKEASSYGGLHQRPLLCVVDRNLELAVGIQHSWTYRPLVHDILGLKLNRCILQPPSNSPGAGSTRGRASTPYELDHRDPFWVAHASSPFPKAAEEVDALLKKWTHDKDEVNRSSSTMQAAEDGGLLDGTKQLTAAMNAVPEMVERKRMIDKHINIGGALLDEIKARAIDAFFTMEEDLLTRGVADKSALFNILRQQGTKEDKLRLALIYLLASESSPGDLEAVESVLREHQIDAAPLNYLKQLKRLNQSLASTNAAAATAGSRDDLLDWAGKLYGQGITRVKNLLSTVRQLALAQLTEALAEAKAGPEVDTFLVLDPRSSSRDGLSATAPKGPFRDAVVFVIGGGNYVEYASLQEYAQKQQPPKNIVYGSTEMLSGTEFLSQLSELGNKMNASVIR